MFPGRVLHVQEYQQIKHAAPLWRALEESVSSKGKCSELTSTIDLANIRLGKSNIANLFQRIYKIKATHWAADQKHPDKYYIPFVLNALPRRFQPAKQHVITSDIYTTLDKLKNFLESVEEGLNREFQYELQDRQEKRGGGRRAMVAAGSGFQGQRSGEGGAQHGGGSRNQGGGGGYFPFKCHNCDEVGHKAINCTKPKKHNHWKPKGGAFKKPYNKHKKHHGKHHNKKRVANPVNSGPAPMENDE